MFKSIHPLKTHPKPPSPSKVSERKFLVAFFKSVKLKDLRLLCADTSTLDAIKDLFKLLNDDSPLGEVETCFASPLGFVAPERTDSKIKDQLSVPLRYYAGNQKTCVFEQPQRSKHY